MDQNLPICCPVVASDSSVMREVFQVLENFDKNRNLNNSQPEICVNMATCCSEKGVAWF